METDISKLKVPELKTLLSKRGESTAGRKAELVSRLTALQESSKPTIDAGGEPASYES